MAQPVKPADKRDAETAPLFRSGAAFTRAAMRYFDACDANGELYSEAGLCLGLQQYGAKGKAVTPGMLRIWYDDDAHPALRDAVQAAYLRIQHQIETDTRYWEKSGIASRAAYLLRQRYFGGYPEEGADKAAESTVHVVFGTSVDASDFM